MNMKKISMLAQVADLVKDLMTQESNLNMKLAKKADELIAEIEKEIKAECK